MGTIGVLLIFAMAITPGAALRAGPLGPSGDMQTFWPDFKSLAIDLKPLIAPWLELPQTVLMPKNLHKTAPSFPSLDCDVSI